MAKKQKKKSLTYLDSLMFICKDLILKQKVKKNISNGKKTKKATINIFIFA